MRRSLRSRPERLLLWAAAGALGVAAEANLYGWGAPRDWVPDLVTGWTLAACGLIAWQLRPASRSGLLLAAAGFAWFAPNFAMTRVAAIGWVSAHALYLHRGPLVQLALTYPRGRPTRRLEVGVITGAYAISLVTPVWGSATATLGLAGTLGAAAAISYGRSIGLERRERLRALQVTGLLAGVLAAPSAIRAASGTSAALHVYQAGLCVLSVVLLAGLVRAPWERVAVTDLVVELGDTRSGTLRDELARALGDPTLKVGFWVPEQGAYVDGEGRPLTVPAEGSGRLTTSIDRDGQPIALLVHDPAILGDPALAEAISSAANLAAANARLQAELRIRLAEVAASRRRILAARDSERDRLERRLREGAQRRLDELARTLTDARAAAGAESTIERVAECESQLARTREELRRFARGIHPRELSELGLVSALASLAADFPMPVDLAVSPIDASPAIEACIYFVCSEGLVNVAKYSSASSVTISVTSGADSIALQIEDDGVGGADPARGSGLRGLADRVATLGGTLTVDSPSGGGTRLTAELPTSA